jgi:hypothetical protein
MSKRRLDRLERSLFPKEAAIRWLGEAHAFGSLPAYVASLIDQPDAKQPFIALPAQVEKAVWESMRGKRTGFIKEVTREAVGDTVFLVRLVVALNVHVEETLRTERLRHAALYWWSRTLGPAPAEDGDATADRWSDWRRGVAIQRGELSGTEHALTEAETRYLDGRDCLFPELAVEWGEFPGVAEPLIDGEVSPDEEAARVRAGQRLQHVVVMARADALDASGQHEEADAVAKRVLPSADETEGGHG